MGTASTYIEKHAMEQVIANMLGDNQIIMKIAIATGLRVTDILNLRIGDIRQNFRIRITEHKTGKTKWVYIPAKLRKEILRTRFVGQHDGYYAFPGRIHWQTKHRTRQAVYKDMQRAIKAANLQLHCSPHSARKIYAVEALRKYGDIKKVSELLNHSDKATTMLYALSDLI